MEISAKHAGKWHELKTLVRFGVIGIAATAVHVTIVFLLIERANAQPILANLIAFAFAFVVSFSGQYYWTFRSKRRISSAVTRFFLVAFSAFLVNNVVLITLLDMDLMQPSLAAVLAVFVIPLISYLLGRFWAF